MEREKALTALILAVLMGIYGVVFTVIDFKRQAEVKARWNSFASVPYEYRLPAYGTWFYAKNEEDYRFLVSGAARKPRNEARVPGWYLVVPAEGSGILQEGKRVYSYDEVREELGRVLAHLPREVAGAGAGR
ncbi:hypothetical protein [Desulfovirgula thermocuniculi]|uniref:hypothetical protein n=1 Tax=Desulfovirgula thermocuniculi TaxID=348842 RepID=UPI000487952C|nr:hypothetical protein [Desulfovirgula thermocuniculi]